MDPKDFRQSLTAGRPPRGLPAPLRALWHAARGNWNRAHDIVAVQDGRGAARVHAYLHRKQGDIVNADYWYYRAGATRPHARQGVAGAGAEVSPESVTHGFLVGFSPG